LTIAASLVTDTSFTASWTAPSGATGYLLDVSVDTFKTYVTGFESFPVTETSQHVGGLATNVLHFYRVRATGPGGTSGYSDTATVVTTFHPSDRPVALEADSITQTQFRARWRPAAGATGYRLDVATDSLFADLLPSYADISVVDTTQVVSGLTPATHYYYRVRGTNESGASQNSDTIKVTTLPPAPVALSAVDVTSGSFRALWRATTGAEDYRLDVATDSLFATFLPGYEDLAVADTQKLVTNLHPATLYYYRVRAAVGGTVGVSSQVISVLTSGVLVQVKVLLEGAAVSDTMRTSLRSSGYVPLAQPYGGAPWNYAGSEQVDSIPPGVVDWVLLELRSDSTTTVARKAAFLITDGTVVGDSGSEPVTFPDVAAGSYYILVWHRNHLAIMSDTSQTLSEVGLLYDFTTGLEKAYGVNAMKQLTSGLFGMVVGDANADGYVTSTDFNVFNPRFTAGATGYEPSDWNLDGYVTSTDFNFFNANFTAGRQTRVP
jgi:hypothetical protein